MENLRQRKGDTESISQNVEEESPDIVIEDEINQENSNSSHTSKPNEQDNKVESGSAFECNICFDDPSQPVLSKCGHLYCWPCIYRWINSGRSVITCPVCKSGIDIENLIPIYGRGGSTKDPRETIPEGEEEIPPRPAGQRVEAPPPNQYYGGHQWPHGMPRLPHGSNFTFTAGIGPIGLYSYGSAGIPGPMTAQEAQQAHASKLVALIGLVLLFVIFVN